MKRDLSVMIKPSSGSCNMRCKYCFYHSVASNRETYAYGLMSAETAEKIIAETLEFSEGGSVYFSFQGGEPLIVGLDYYKGFVAAVARLNTLGSKIYYNIQTNGTLVTQEWTDFFRENEFLVGLSLDGDRAANDNRIFADGSETFERVLDTADNFLNYGVEFNVLTVATAYTARHAEDIYCFLRDRGYKYQQYIPVLRPFGEEHKTGGYYLDNETMFLLLDRLFRLYVADFLKGNYVSIRLFDNWVRMFLGERGEQCGTGGFCTRQLVFEADGSAYPCDFYCLDDYRLGNIKDKSLRELFETPAAIDFLKAGLVKKPACSACRYFSLCRGGGCKRSKAEFDYCKAYKAFFAKNMPLFTLFQRVKK